MNPKVLSILDNALEVAEKSDKPQKETICALVQLVNMYDEEGGLCDDDIKQLDTLGFFWDEADECFISFRFGSC